MQTRISPRFEQTAHIDEAEAILRSCVHCGFCTATCPTYQLLGDELDSPRGRIYLIKQLLEGQQVTEKTQQHLDRCLTCRACETTCPSGVRYSRLADIGRELINQQVKRRTMPMMKRLLLRKVIPYPNRFGTLLRVGQAVKPMLPQVLRDKIPDKQNAISYHPKPQVRQMILFDGCAQSSATPQTNVSVSRVLEKLGIEMVRVSGAGCCGAVSQHLSAADEARDFMRRNIDAWWPLIEAGAEAIVISASGCGTQIKEYGEQLNDDPLYADKARRVSELAKDICEVVSGEDLTAIENQKVGVRVSFHCPCTLQHGQQLVGLVEKILDRAGYELVPVADSHLCCGSAGTYSLLQPELSQRLRENKVAALQANQPDIIVTANIGCQLHISSAADIPVKHWIELLDDTMTLSTNIC
jgi:glycolate oxidase iron-sulfur subunit